MAIDINSSEGQLIRKLIPLNTLSGIHFEALCLELFIEQCEKGRVLIKQGENDEYLIYLLDGEVSLQAGGLKIETIKANTIAAQFALAHQNPRQINVVASRDVQYISINRDLLDKPPTVYQQEQEQENNYVVNEDESIQEGDWMAILLRSPLFRDLSPQSLQKVLLQLEEVNYAKGDKIIEQDEEGDYFYLIKKGHCLQTRKPNSKAKAIKLAQFRKNDTFGEDALISGEKQNFSVRALTNCSLLRMQKEHFFSLIKDPALKFLDYDALPENEEIQIIDVRMPDEFQVKHLEGSVNMPFFSLRMQMKNIDRAKKVVIVCDDGKISEAASFLLFKYRFEPYILKGGINEIKEDISRPSATFEISDGVGVVLNHESTPTPPAEIPSLSAIEKELQNIKPHSPIEEPGEEVEGDVFSELTLDIAQIEEYENGLAEQIEVLNNENQRLKKTVQTVQQQYKKLLDEKSKLEKQLIAAVKKKNELEQLLNSQGEQ